MQAIQNMKREPLSSLILILIQRIMLLNLASWLVTNIWTKIMRSYMQQKFLRGTIQIRPRVLLTVRARKKKSETLAWTTSRIRWWITTHLKKWALEERKRKRIKS